MSTTIDALRDRITSLVVSSPFAFHVPETPDGAADVPIDQIHESVKVEVQAGEVQGRMGLYETRIDRLVLTIARLQQGDPQACYVALLQDVNSLSAAVIRDGALGGGDYHVPDGGRGFVMQHTPGAAFSAVRLTLPLDYETTL